MFRILRTLLIVLVIVLMLAVGAFVVWGSTPPQPMPAALTALETDDSVAVSTDPWLTFTPQAQSPTAGLIFYPGGRVDARSYAPAMRAIAEAGYLTVIPPMPLNLAVFDVNAAADIIAMHSEITCWAVGGHSLGGSMAAQYAGDHPDQVDGLVFWASYPALDLSQTALDVLTVFGTEDGLAQRDQISNSLALLPADTLQLAIDGGNHAQFGDYGDQQGDNPASITRAEQQRQAAEATAQFLAGMCAK